MLKPLDLLLTLKLLALEEAQKSGAPIDSGRVRERRTPYPPLSFEKLGDSLAVSASQVHAAAQGAKRSRLIRENFEVRRTALALAIQSVAIYIPGELGGSCRGIPTSLASSTIERYVLYREGTQPVWPSETGDTVGLKLNPIHRAVPVAVADDPTLYRLLALIDALRVGRAREREFAHQEFQALLGGHQ
jgi:hypothetical protein